MIGNLPEGFLYDRLPDALIDLDERGLIFAVVSGIQDRLEDLRAYGKNMQQFFAVNDFPQTGDNVVLVDLQSDQGKMFTRSLDIQLDTPPDGSPALPTWAAGQLGLPVSVLMNVRYGVDLLRLVNINTLDYLASTIGAVLYQSSIIPPAGVQLEQQQIIGTYFPRLQIKGTVKSFDALGRILGFDDIRMTPLWSRLSVREPNDIGDAVNDVDFASEPDYAPQQHFDDFYNPLVTDDGPFYTWSGTANNGTASTQFYTQSINGFSPYINVVVLGVQNGTTVPPANGTYALGSSGTQSMGGPHMQAYVDPPGATIRFEAIAEGASFNGMIVSVGTDATGTNTTLSISDRLSSIKYRSSYFDLGITAYSDKIEEVFGSSAAQTNTDLQNDPDLTPDGTAISPFRPWISGSLTTGLSTRDFITSVGTGTPSVVTARVQASAVDRQLNFDSVIAAGVQVTQAFEEVRPATRLARRALTGILHSDTVGYAPYGDTGVVSELWYGIQLVWHFDVNFDASNNVYDAITHMPLQIVQEGTLLPLITPGKLGNCVEFQLQANGSESYLTETGTNTTPYLHLQGDRTFAFWYFPTATATFPIVMEVAISGFSPTFEWQILADSSAVQMFIGNGVGGGGFFDASITPASWNHVVITFTHATSNCGVYVNGAFSGSFVQTPIFAGTTIPFTMGADEIQDSPGQQSVDEFDVWNRVLTQAEIVALYNNGTGVAYPFA